MSLLLLATSPTGTPAAPAVPLAARNSLIVGPFDVCDETSPVQLVYSGGHDFDRGAAVPSATTITSDLLDGARVVGDRSENRSPTLPLIVLATDPVTGQPTDTLTRKQLLNTLLRTVSQPTWPLVWTPAGGLPVVLDCFRAVAPLVSPTLAETAGAGEQLNVTCQALPFTRSPTPVVVPLTGSPTVLTPLTALPTSTTGAATFSSSTAGVSVGFASTTGPVQVSVGDFLPPTTLTPGVITVQTVVSNLRLGNPILAFTGADTGRTYQIPGIIDPTQIRFPLTATEDATGVRVGSVPEPVNFWRIIITGTPTITGGTATTYLVGGAGRQYTGTLTLSQLVAYPAGAGGLLVARGGTYLLADMPGSARAPINLALQMPSGARFSEWLVHRPPADSPAAVPILPVDPAARSGSAAGSRYAGTYTVYASVSPTAATISSPRTLTLTFTQRTVSGGQSWQVSAPALSVQVPALAARLVRVGTVSLPIAGQPDGITSTLTVQTGSTVSSDVISDVLLLDTRGETILCQPPTPNMHAWVDEPGPLAQASGVYGDGPFFSGRQFATSLAASCWPLTIPLSVDPGANQLLVYSPEGALQATATVYPRWLMDADR